MGRSDAQRIALCASTELVDGGIAVAFDVCHRGQNLRAFAVRHAGRVHAYLNRCTHVAMEMDLREGHFFDDSGCRLICATHGALFAPDTGECLGGPARGPLLKVVLSEEGGMVYWHTAPDLQTVAF